MEPTAGDGRPRFLVVDDALTGTHAARLLLEAEGVRPGDVREAFTATEALRVFEETRPEVVILDLGLPDMGGDALAARLRAIDPDARIVALRGLSRLNPQVIRAETSGVDQVLPKPLTRSQVRTIVELARGRLPARFPGDRAGGEPGDRDGDERAVPPPVP